MKTKVCTHSGEFHADDVTAIALLNLAYNHNTDVVRSRDPKVWAESQILVDVCGEYKPDELKFDHHFVGCPVRGESNPKLSGIPYASCGMVWKHYYDQIIDTYRGGQFLSAVERHEIYNMLDEIVIAGIDALDSGYSLPTSNSSARLTNLTDLVHNLNQPWWEKSTEGDQLNRFLEAVAFVEKVLSHKIESAIRYLDVVKEIDKAYDGGEVLELDQFFPWQRAVCENRRLSEVLYVIYPCDQGYMIQTVPTTPGSFEARKPLPESWAGKRGEELEKITGVGGCIFCHPARFIAGAMTLEGARKLASICKNV